MEIIPALDLREGKCVRLYQGDFDKETVFSHDPLEVAHKWAEEGAMRLHIVDLDGARTGRPANLDVVRKIASQVSIDVQMGGGVRNLKVASEILDMGAERVVLGTAAVQDAQLVQDICIHLGTDNVIVAVDAHAGDVAVKGWQERTSVKALDLVTHMANIGVVRFLYTDISRDGTMTEPNFKDLKSLCAKKDLAIQAAGGISTIEHLNKLGQIGAEGAIVGSAILNGAIILKEAIDIASTVKSEKSV